MTEGDGAAAAAHARPRWLASGAPGGSGWLGGGVSCRRGLVGSGGHSWTRSLPAACTLNPLDEGRVCLRKKRGIPRMDHFKRKSTVRMGIR